MTSAQEKFQALLRELFQFDCADLDFGIYRIMNFKRDVVEKFITEDLPEAIADELDRGALAEQSRAASELKKVAEQIAQTLGNDALDADGNLAEAYHGTPLGKKYLDLKARAGAGGEREALEASVYNHLYAFFSRYYQDGDFISKRRYSKRQRYAIPYNGEEVYLYWANHDQYYIKTTEHFRDYSYKAPNSVTVHFRLVAADVEQDNVKGDKRFILPLVKGTEWREDASELVIPFEYRPLTEQEQIRYGKRNEQDTIIADAIVAIPQQLSPKDTPNALAALTAERRKTADGDSVSYLEHHLRQYTRRNTSDYFIHKDLGGFLSGELDFYLKNEVLNLEEMEAAGEDLAGGWFQLMRVVKAVGARIIGFLAQIEGFQKMLWEKRKFITETQYCITVGNMDERFYPDIAACEAQWAEWRELFHIDEEQTDLFTHGKSQQDRRIAFLKAHPTLVLDTKHFEQGFVDSLLGSFDEVDETTDGLMVHSENFQALSLLLETYREQIKCVYIDPPYNTGSDDYFPYKDMYMHSSWLSMMYDRLAKSAQMLAPNGVLCVSIDDREKSKLRELMDAVFGTQAFVACFVRRRRASSAMSQDMISQDHEYVLTFAGTQFSSFTGLPKQYSSYSNPDNDPRGDWVAGDLTVGMTRDQRPNQFYDLVDPNTGRTYAPDPDRVWAYYPETMQEKIRQNLIIFPEDTSQRPKLKRFKKDLRSRRNPISTWIDTATASRGIAALQAGLNTESAREIQGLFGSSVFPYAKPKSLVSTLVEQVAVDSDMVMDFFAGSATTAHAVIDLNRGRGARRAFILAEIGEYFDDVMLPRVKKVTFSPEWREGKPKRRATPEEAERSPRLVKYIRLESYEDALNNIEFDEASGQQAMEFDDYLLRYMLQWETRASETLLNVEKLTLPFSYKLHIHAGGETREKAVDLPESFNYLLGLHVQTRRVYDDAGRRYLVYRGRIDHRQIVVMWRETEGWTKEDFERDKAFVGEQGLTEGADQVFVNGDSLVPTAEALEPVFKARMFAPLEE